MKSRVKKKICIVLKTTIRYIKLGVMGSTIHGHTIMMYMSQPTQGTHSKEQYLRTIAKKYQEIDCRTFQMLLVVSIGHV